MKIKNEKLPKITTLVILFVAVLTLFILRTGIADNGNLSSTLQDIGLYDCQGATGSGYFADSFGVASKETGNGTGGIVYGLFKLFMPVDSVLFVYFPAIIYLAIFILGIYLFLKNSLCESFGNNILLCALTAVVIADSGYIMFFNTPYTEGAFISFLALCAGAFMAFGNTNKKLYLIISGIFACLIGALGINFAFSGLLIAFAFLYFVKNNGALVKILSVVMSVLVICSSLFGFTVDKSSDTNRYNRIFYGILNVAENKENALKELGIDEKYAEYANVPFFEEKAQEFIASEEFSEIKEKADVKNILAYYLNHTSEFKEALKISAQNGTSIKSTYLGNFSASSNKPFQSNSLFGLYNILKPKVIPASLPILLILLAGVIVLGFGFIGKFKGKYGVILTSLLALSGILTFPMAMLLNGFSMIDFNMLTFNFLFDCVLISAITGGLRIMWIKQQTLRDKFGVNQ